MRGRRSLALALALLGSILPAFAIKACASAYADSLADRIAGRLSATVAALPARAGETGSGQSAEFEPSFDERPNLQSAAFAAKRSGATPRARPVPKQGIRVTSAQVLALAARRAMPQAVFVQASAERPAGLLLSGVSGLGIGLQDGDVLTEAAGQKATSVAAVVGIVLAARSRQASEISGRFYRGSVPFLLTVEQPYPKQALPG
ncbi:MAG TPA: hypothetical protein VFK05_01480 [Polyangiaceae bacterium]|nr:hypothetical protein [Polyangiaceae bacterium]